MSGKTVHLVLITFLLYSLCTVSDALCENRRNTIQVYLLREVTIKGDTISLSQVGIIRGEEALAARASEIALGRISVPGQKMIIDRPTVLSRLASNGIPASKVTLTGAEKIMVKQQQQIIKGSKFVEQALLFLEKNPPADSVCQLNPIRIPADLVVPTASKDIKLSPRPAGSSAANQARVRIAVLADGKQIGFREVTFRLKYNCRRVVTLAELGAGTVISPENVRIEKTIENYPDPANWSPPYGLVTKRRLGVNTVIRPNMAGAVKPPVLLNRNQTVIIRIERPGLLITAIGKTMQKARAGEYIKVRNMDSRRIIFAKVNENGTVEPVF
ncbi:MAG TPA: flagellar basal body P-ring formation protein FlgA [Phycisphaerales bacterium]|nr:flagellar basal body P-ring formation protein FlgA [Phycisphaerales bacterium]